MKNTENAEQAASCIEYFVLFPGFRPSGRARKAVEIRSTRGWALLGMAFGVGFGIRRVSMSQECRKICDVSSDFYV